MSAKLSAAASEALADPRVREKFASLGQETQQAAASLHAYHEAEIKL